MHLVDRGAVKDVVLGVGLVGGAVVKALQRRPDVARTHTMTTSWGNPTALGDELAAAGAWLGSGGRVRIIWSAGRGGFASTAADLAKELESFRVVLSWSERLATERPVEFHLTSSAGGLHEGQRRVTGPEPIDAPRPYGKLKLDQENLLAGARGLVRFVYRPSSVYGVPRKGARLGMVPTLIRNALARRPSTIVAHPNTLRDYVSAQDVGDFIASESNQPGLHYLVMGRPMSLMTLVATVERALERQVAVVYSTSRVNDQHITFAPSLKPLDWNPGPLESHVALIVAAILKG